MLAQSAEHTAHGGDARASAKKACPKNYKVISGGVLTDADDVDIIGTQPYDGSDADHKPDDGWQGIVSVGAVATSFVVFAICKIHDADDPTYVKAKASTVDNSEGSALAGCSATEHVLGGGGSVSGSDPNVNVAVSTSFTDLLEADINNDDGWVYGVNNDGTGDHTITAWAICVPFLPTYGFDNDTVGTGSQQESAPCPAVGQAVLSGGFSSSGGRQMHTTNSVISGGPTWQAKFYNNTGTTQSASAEAICVPL